MKLAKEIQTTLETIVILDIIPKILSAPILEAIETTIIEIIVFHIGIDKEVCLEEITEIIDLIMLLITVNIGHFKTP